MMISNTLPQNHGDKHAGHVAAWNFIVYLSLGFDYGKPIIALFIVQIYVVLGVRSFIFEDEFKMATVLWTLL